MREIKFRAWDNHYKYMNYKVLVGIYGEWEKVKDDKNYTACCMWIEPDKVDYQCEPHWTHFEPYHKDIYLMQYTGLKDKNGIEIYEGDIVKLEYIGEDEERPIKEGVMNFRENQWRVNKKHLDGFTMRMYTREVIGNIYEGRSE